MMMTPFEEKLIESLFPDFVAWSNECIATYMLHRRDGNNPLFFKKMTDEILDVALAHVDDLAVYAIKTDGAVDDVTDAWKRVFQKHQSARTAVDELLVKWVNKVPNHVATYELKLDSTTLGYFPKPSHEILRRIDRVRDVRRLTVLAIHKSGTIEDVTSFWMPMFDEYKSLRQ